MTLGFTRGDRFAATESRRHIMHIHTTRSFTVRSREGASVRGYYSLTVWNLHCYYAGIRGPTR